MKKRTAHRAGAILIASALVLVLPSDAGAHLGHQVQQAERYLKLDAGGRNVRVVVSLTMGPREGRRILAAADVDGDGTVSRAEANAYLAQWGEGLVTDLPVRVDGELAEVRWGEPYLEPAGRVREVPLSVEMIATLTLEGGRRTVTVQDRMRTETFDRTDVAFRARDGARLVASGPGMEPLRRVPDLSYGRGNATEALSITAVFELPEEERAFPTWLLIPAAALVLLAAGAALALWRRGRSASSAG